MNYKKKVCFVQVGFDFDGSVYLPYSTGVIAAYSLNNPEIASKYDLSTFIFRRELLSVAEKEAMDAYIVAFSCNVWNMEYNKKLARRIKAKNPECIVIFGGHSVGENADVLRTENCVDILMFGEGEQTFADILIKLPSNRLDEVFNIAYRDAGKILTTDRKYYQDISDYPSAYLSGMFDKILKDNPTVHFLSVLETNRGCPYACAYCDWCVDKKVRFFPMKKVLSEIDWLSEHKIGYCFCADSNFGMFDRDVEIAQALATAKKKNGYPEILRPCYEKNSDERVFKICQILNNVGMDKGATLAYQTLSAQALENIGRKNLTLEHFSSLIKRYVEAGISTYSELILGLPGETSESFCSGICRLLENGQHNSLSVYHCEMLPNSEMSSPEFIKKHGIEVIKVAFNHIHSAINRNEEVQEYSYLVRSTNTMSRDDWVYANLFSVCVQCFHSLGLLRCVAMYLHTQNHTSYLEFYTALLAFIMNDDSGKLNSMWNEFKYKYENSLSGDWNYHCEKFGNVTWFFEEGAFLEIISNYDLFQKEIYPFLKQFGMNKELFDSLMEYQRAVIKKPFSHGEKHTFNYDFYTYFESIIEGNPIKLQNVKTQVAFTPGKYYDSLPDYAREIVWFGRRRGATVYRGKEVELKMEGR